MKLSIPGTAAAKAQLGSGAAVPLFPTSDGAMAGLLPVAVTHNPGTYELLILDANGQVLERGNVMVIDGKYPIQNIQAAMR